MDDKQFYERGAECVAGDLILDRVVVGRYRNGQFVLTAEGAELAESAAPEEPKAKAKAKAKPAKAPKTADLPLEAVPSDGIYDDFDDFLAA